MNKIQFNFLQGLERHLLGSHGLVTASMQELANKGQDSGRCPVCGKMFHWKLLNHVAKDHMKTLKPAHLSYKCTVCTATFGQYKLFENHVYSAHSGGRKSAGAPSKPAGGRPPTIGGRPLKVSDEITIIPQGKSTQVAKKTMVSQPPPKRKAPEPAQPDPDVIEIDDEEEEIDDVEDDSDKRKNGKASPAKRKTDDDNGEGQSSSKSAKTSATSSEANSAAEDSGEEGIEEIKDDDEVDDD